MNIGSVSYTHLTLPTKNDDENSFYTFDIEPLYAKLLYAEDRACSNRGLNSCGFYIEGFRCDHGDFASPYRNRERAALR